MKLFAIGLIYCKYCSHETKTPRMIDENSIYCRYCVSKHCFDCVQSMHQDVYQRLLSLHEDDERYDLSNNFADLDYVNRMLSLQCGDCLVAIKKCESADWEIELDPRQVM